MPQTKAGVKNNAWIQFQRNCAKEYHEQRKSAKDGGASHATAKAGPQAQSNAHPKPQSKSQKTKELNTEEHKEKANAMKLHRAATKQLRANAHAVDNEMKTAKATTAAAAKQRLVVDGSKTHKALHDDAVARAHGTVVARRARLTQ